MTPEVARQFGLRARRQLDPSQRDAASRRICSRLAATAWFSRARTVALYLASSDEADLSALILYALRHHKTVAVPKITGTGQMHFVAIDENTTFATNRYAIAEPVLLERYASESQVVTRPDLICAPLSAFDAQFNRTGMGSGYYDRFLSQRKRHPCTRTIGVGFSCQRVNTIASNEWDVPMDGICTERYFRRLKRD
ncbi:MAG: 5-formyltetrahydrofolate cyclo-ligase [Pseudomonadota bacterium]